MALRLHRPVGSAVQIHAQRPVIYVRLVAEGGDGWGESPALAEDGVVDPSHDEVWDALLRQVVPAFLANGGDRPPVPTERSRRVERWAWSAVEMAWWDLRCRSLDRSLAEDWGPGLPEAVAVGAMVGVPDDRRIDTVLRQADEAVAAGYRRLRVKVAPGWDVEPLEALRRRHPSLPLQADCNTAYSWSADGESDARSLQRLDALELTCLEQPLAAHDLEGHARLADWLATPICLDESLWSVERLDRAVELGACRVACLKPPRLGGLAAGRQALARCRVAGIRAFVGGYFETGLARAAHATLGGLPGCELPGDLCPPGSYLPDPCGYPSIDQGMVLLHQQPGVGRRPSAERLSTDGTERQWLARAGVQLRRRSGG